ncbi:MAG: hypothetical protein MJ197_09925 [Bacteroidales bacterium]|nr:hypothetical protein [Bacteroidales bacterium]
MYNKIMHDKIFQALKDERNGGIQAIYTRIRRTGSPFKTIDKRHKYSTSAIVKDSTISRQTISWRLKHGWSIEDATTKPVGKKKKDEQNT